MLVDPGASKEGEQSFLKVLDSLKWVKKMFVLVTHYHKDHHEGLGLLAKKFPEAVVILSAFTKETVDLNLAKKIVCEAKVSVKSGLCRFAGNQSSFRIFRRELNCQNRHNGLLQEECSC